MFLIVMAPLLKVRICESMTIELDTLPIYIIKLEIYASEHKFVLITANSYYLYSI